MDAVITEAKGYLILAETDWLKVNDVIVNLKEDYIQFEHQYKTY